MDYMDTLVYFHNKVFNASKWNSFKFLLEFKTVETRGPFFPFLFVLAMEVLSWLLERTREGGSLLGFRVGWGGGRRREGERGDGSLSSFVSK